MTRTRNPPLWERKAPLTPEQAAKMHRSVRSTYVVAVAVFWAVCAGTAITLHTPVVVAAVAVFAVLDAGAMWWAFRDARAGIRRNTVPQPLNRPDVGL
jgi:Flp pilus assembly protein TadB